MNHNRTGLSQLKTPAKPVPNRIDKLYNQFEALKLRIRSSSSHRQHRVSTKAPLINEQLQSDNWFQTDFGPSQRETIKQDFQLLVSSPSAPNKSTALKQIKIEKSQSEQDLLEVFTKCLTAQVSKIETTIQSRVTILEGKLKICEEVIRGVKKILSVKKSFRPCEIGVKYQNKRPHSQNQKQSASVIQLVNGYEAKISTLVQVYEERLRQLESNSSKGRETLSTKNGSLRSELNQFESLLLSKDSEIGALRLQNCRLRKANDRLMNDANSTAKKVSELEERLKDYGQAKNAKCSDVQIQADLVVEQGKKEYKDEKFYRPKQLTPFINMESIGFEEKSSCSGDKEAQIISICKIEDRLAQSEMGSHKSLIYSPKRKRANIETIRGLEAEIDLLSEENKNLEAKKHFLEAQYRNSEMDEERFQQQSSIYKNEIKNLSSSLKALDELSVALLTHKQLNQKRVQQLGEELKCKEYFKTRCYLSPSSSRQ